MTMTTVKLKDLTPSKNNPRTVFAEDALAGLAASIKTDGLLQNLVVRKAGKKHEIISGERRYRALKLLQQQGDIDGNYPVAVDVRKGVDADEALRLATVENIQREALAPIDEAEAFAILASSGSELADIAAKAGVSEATVKRRLAIAGLCDEAKEAVRNGSISLSVAEALTIGTADQQREVLNQDNHWLDAENVKAFLVDEKLPLTAAIFPIEQYSGSVTRDLFAGEEETFFDDMQQFHKLQAAAVERQAQLHKDSNAAFVDVVTEHHASWWQYRAAEEGEATGVVIHHAPSGRVEIRAGLVRKPVKDSVKAAVKEAKPRPEYSSFLLAYIANQKTLAVQSAILTDARMAKIMAIVQMMNGVDRQGSAVSLDAHAAHKAFIERDSKPTALLALEEAAASASTGLAIKHVHSVERSDLPLAVRLTVLLKDPIALYESVKELPDEQLDRLLVTLTTLCFGQARDALDTNADSLFNRVAADLGVNMADHWRPTYLFLSKRTLEQLKQIAKDSGALTHIGMLKDYKKKDLVNALARFFQRKDIETAATWLPDAMLFPAKSNEVAPQEEVENIAEDEMDDDLEEEFEEEDEEYEEAA